MNAVETLESFVWGALVLFLLIGALAVVEALWAPGLLDDKPEPDAEPEPPKVFLVPEIADPEAPTVAELNAGIDLSHDATLYRDPRPLNDDEIAEHIEGMPSGPDRWAE